MPYLPSYCGYVRYLVGIVLTIAIGPQAIISLNKYFEKQRLTETMPEAERRETLSYDMALARLACLYFVMDCSAFSNTFITI